MIRHRYFERKYYLLKNLSWFAACVFARCSIYSDSTVDLKSQSLHENVFAMIFFAFEAARATMIVKITAMTVTSIA